LLSEGTALRESEKALLMRIQRLHERCPQLSTSITSPLNLLSELFTVRGAGTLVKTGATIKRLASYAEVDLERLTELLESTFGHRLRSGWNDVSPLHLYIESEYRGAAIVLPGPARFAKAAYLTKFAVNRAAQCDGMQYESMPSESTPSETMPSENAQCESMPSKSMQCETIEEKDASRAASACHWRIYWRGIETARIPEIVEDAKQRPIDFLSSEE
jgi:acetylglutamate kinase